MKSFCHLHADKTRANDNHLFYLPGGNMAFYGDTIIECAQVKNVLQVYPLNLRNNRNSPQSKH